MTDHSDLIERLVIPMVRERSREPGDAWHQAEQALSSQSLSLSEAREEIERLKGLVAGIRETPQEPWQDIATAPKDGDSYLFHDPILGTIYGHWYDGDDEDEPCWFFFDWCGDELIGCDPTLWTPLPRARRSVAPSARKEAGDV